MLLHTLLIGREIEIRRVSSICKRLSIQSLAIAYSRTNILFVNTFILLLVCTLQECGKVSAENTKYAEHYTSYGYSSRKYGNFAEILK